MKLSLKGIGQYCAGNFEAMSHIFISNDVVTLHVNTYSKRNKNNSECERSNLHPDYALMELFIVVQGIPR